MARTLGKSFAKQLALKQVKRPGSITFDQLINGVIEKEPEDKTKVWDHHIQAVKDMIAAGKVNKMAIAEIAIRSCFIIYGGDVKSEDFKKKHQPHTLKRFAEQCGLAYKTLQCWTQLKRWVFDALPAHHQQTFKLDAAKCVYAEMVSEVVDYGEGITRQNAHKKFEKIAKKDVVEKYEKYITPGANHIWMKKLFGYQGIILHWLETPVKSKHITDDMLEKIMGDALLVNTAANGLLIERVATQSRKKRPAKVKHEQIKEGQQAAGL